MLARGGDCGVPASALSVSCCCWQEMEKAWFLPFIGANDAEFAAYVAEMRRDRVWGDDPEIQVTLGQLCCAMEERCGTWCARVCERRAGVV